MHPSSILAGLFIFCLICTCQSDFTESTLSDTLRKPGGYGGLDEKGKVESLEKEKINEPDLKNAEDDDEYGDEDFDDDDDEDWDLSTFQNQNRNSLTNLRLKKGEVLVPCFGMWWPVGNGGGFYDYGGGYYYDDGGGNSNDTRRRRRRRLRKQKKAAKMKKRKKS